MLVLKAGWHGWWLMTGLLQRRGVPHWRAVLAVSITACVAVLLAFSPAGYWPSAVLPGNSAGNGEPVGQPTQGLVHAKLSPQLEQLHQGLRQSLEYRHPGWTAGAAVPEP